MASLFRTGKHQCNMSITIRDETLHAVQTPCAVSLIVCGLKHYSLQVATCIWFSQIHCHCFSGAYSRQETLTLVFVCKLINGLCTVLKSPDIHKACVCTAHHIGSHNIWHQREIQAIVSARQGNAHKTGFHQCVKIFLSALRINNVTVNHMRSFMIYVFCILSNNLS